MNDSLLRTLIPPMSTEMFSQVSHCWVWLFTVTDIYIWARKWFFFCMASQVIKEIMPLSKQFWAIWPFAFHYENVPQSSYILIFVETKLSGIWQMIHLDFFPKILAHLRQVIQKLVAVNYFDPLALIRDFTKNSIILVRFWG